MLDSKDHSPENIRGFRYVLVVCENFSKFGWTVALKNKNARTITDFFESISSSSRRKTKNI